jgi:salicylate hydroxylase
MDWLRSFFLKSTSEREADMAKSALQVLIVGGGIGGLAAAIAICRAGHSVTVLESAEKIEEVSSKKDFIKTRNTDSY